MSEKIPGATMIPVAKKIPVAKTPDAKNPDANILAKLLLRGMSIEPVPTTPRGKKAILQETKGQKRKIVSESTGRITPCKHAKCVEKELGHFEGGNSAHTKNLGALRLTMATNQTYIQQKIDGKLKLVVAVNKTQSAEHGKLGRMLFQMAQHLNAGKEELVEMRNSLIQEG